jgi:site-specific DNA-methyltransferase (adenine-specific)
MTAVTLHPGDNRVSLRRLIDAGVRVHSVVTDAPYGLVSVTKRFGKAGAAAAKFGTDGAFSRASAGFMGKAWDGTGIERDPEFWRLIHDILLPGGYVFAFSSSRTGHWQACAMELAGFVMHPMHGWTFGSGFPKAHNAAMAIDKALGLEGSKVASGDPVRRIRPGADQNKGGSWEKLADREYQPGTYVPASPEAAEWDGWAYGTQSQKPALEPIYLGQRPFSERTGAANLMLHGVGAVNVAGCRVPFASDEDERESKEKNQHAQFESGPMTNEVYGKFTKDRDDYNPPGRWPANLLHDGTHEVATMFPQAGPDSAARFFNCFPPDMDPLFYQGKAGKKDRAGSTHPTVKPIALMQHLIRHITPPGGVVLDPFAGSGTTAEAARREGFDCILMEAEPEYLDFLRQRFDLPAPRLSQDILDLLGGSTADISALLQ